MDSWDESNKNLRKYAIIFLEVKKTIKQSNRDNFARVAVSAVNIQTDFGRKYCTYAKRIRPDYLSLSEIIPAIGRKRTKK